MALFYISLTAKKNHNHAYCTLKKMSLESMLKSAWKLKTCRCSTSQNKNEGHEKLLQILDMSTILTIYTENCSTDQPFKNMVNFELKDCVAPSACNS